ncbi:dephospho-CoA kinase [Bacillus sp. JJ1764]|uniref:dephospho-CoA kinase n=1 Tax=Bacillus sp. JJ1764 TaxID=3122964 RepID=UPI002FFEE152
MSLVIGLTGGIASGKSTVSNMFKEWDIRVVDADVESRLAVEKGEPAYLKIVEKFGCDVLLPDGGINREKLGSIIFHDAKKRQLLNQIVHPEVRNRMKQRIEEGIKNREKVIVLDIPLLFESKLTFMVEKTILIYVDEPTQLQRLIQRNQLSTEDAQARIYSQMPLKDKVQLADAVINNNGTIEETEKQLIEVLTGWGITL